MLLVLQCHSDTAFAIPFSIDSFFHSVLVDLMIAINLNIIFKASAVR